MLVRMLTKACADVQDVADKGELHLESGQNNVGI